jgi:CMP-N,N'-diacetyllegionaminic acid synthase
MINKKKILAVLPARGGSKRIPHKNVKLLGGKPLIVWTIEEAKKSNYIDKLILSSEDDEIIRIAEQHGCKAPFKRPDFLSQDDSSSIDVLLHALSCMSDTYDYFILLQPTSPLRNARHIDESIDLCVSNGYKTLTSITPFKKNPRWIYAYRNRFIEPLGIPVPEVDSPNGFFILNGAIYIAEITAFLENPKLITKNTIGYLMDDCSSIDIDTLYDWEIAEFFLSKRTDDKKNNR